MERNRLITRDGEETCGDSVTLYYAMVAIRPVRAQQKGHRGYSLCISDGCHWWLTCDRESQEWLDRLATIMGLDGSASDGSPKLIFAQMADMEAGVIPGPGTLDRDDGWYCIEYRSLRMWCHISAPDVVCEINNGEGYDREIVNMWTSLQPIYRRSIAIGGLPLHAALVELDGRGAVLPAPCDTGKSTCCRRLPDYWKPLSDDKTLVVHTKRKEYRAHPFPTWSEHQGGPSEKTWNVQYSVPVCAVFFLEQAEVDEVAPVGQGEAAYALSDSAALVCHTFWRKLDIEGQRNFKIELFNNACQMARQIPAFRLRVSLHGRFWEEMEKAMDEGMGV